MKDWIIVGRPKRMCCPAQLICEFETQVPPPVHSPANVGWQASPALVPPLHENPAQLSDPSNTKEK
eukprot:CAMPEP_0171998344 /NCGR_PEP_ID=MMETSP1041-20130122/1184_1 /TAXON_ID=464988 /ORGANISM="Hemiselmis andersenii, Strain CCMP439" /LENGTH=65 /DNA_ID=CAMNT_0012651707 /DNA_START=1060 /DNA_END=1257 /DNA_ORIENTATION=-